MSILNKIMASMILFGGLSGQCYQTCCDPFYVKAGAGVVFPSKDSVSTGASTAVLFQPTIPGTSLFNLPSVHWKNSYSTGYEINAALGYKFSSKIRGEAEFLYQNLRRKITGNYGWREVDAQTLEVFNDTTDNLLREATSRANIYALMTNAFYDIDLCCPFSLSIGGGFGVTWLHSSSTSRDNILVVDTADPDVNTTSPTLEKSPSLKGTAFAWQFLTGLNYDLCERITFCLNYRLFGTTKFQASTSSITSNPGTDVSANFVFPQIDIKGFLNQSINLSAEYHF